MATCVTDALLEDSKLEFERGNAVARRVLQAIRPPVSRRHAPRPLLLPCKPGGDKDSARHWWQHDGFMVKPAAFPPSASEHPCAVFIVEHGRLKVWSL